LRVKCVRRRIGVRPSATIAAVAVASKVEMIEVLVRGDFDAILGTRESAELEFKESAYNAEHDLASLIADVASFANDVGGIIVLGVRTAVDTATAGEIVSAVPGIKQAAASGDSYQK
jgi:hypothetical protein